MKNTSLPPLKVEEKEIHSADRESFQPAYSPDGKQIAYLSGRDEIQVLNRDSGATHVALGREHNYSYSDGDIAFAWSPDSKWLIADYAPRDRLFITNIGIVPADGSAQPVDISHSGYLDSVPRLGTGRGRRLLGEQSIWTTRSRKLGARARHHGHVPHARRLRQVHAQ